jgi:Mg2+/Co2+ transporter CorB
MGFEHTFSIPVLLIILLLLIFLSAFFSASETSLMSVNRYKLRHLAEDKDHRGARNVLKLLQRTDKLLTVILMGNTVANIFASSVATLIGAQLYGESGVLIATIFLTLFVLIFAEIGPKTIMARYPQRFSFIAVLPLKLSLLIFYPFVWFGNTVVKLMLLPFRINISQHKIEELSAEELKHIVRETDDSISAKDEQMLMGILELESSSVQDIMIPRAEIIGINLDDDWQVIFKQLMTSQYTRLPLYSDSFENIYGILHLRDVLHAFAESDLDKEKLIELAYDPIYVPETTRLDQQLLNFQRTKRRIALVVDEYGEIHGLVTLEDILEEIVGDFTTNIAETTDNDIIPQTDGSYIVDASVTVREINRHLALELPIGEAKTMNGLIIVYLDGIPHSGTCLQIKNCRMEIIKVAENKIIAIKIYPLNN